MNVLVVCGGRDYADRARVREVLAEYPPDETVVYHGCAKGADTLVQEEAEKLNIWTGGIQAAWKKYGRAAGPLRNRQLLAKEPCLVIAFPGGRGTRDMVAEARRRGIPVREVEA